MSLEALSTEWVPGQRITGDHMVAKLLASAVAGFITRLERGALSGEVAVQLAKLLHAEQHLLGRADQALEVASAQTELKGVANAELMAGLANYRVAVVDLMKLAIPEEEGFSFAECEAQLQRVQTAYDDTKETLLHAAAGLRIPVAVMIDLLEQNSRIRRMTRQMFKATQLLGDCCTVSAVQNPVTAELVVQQDSVALNKSHHFWRLDPAYAVATTRPGFL
jgi:phosphate:Na+ symporter